jgi:hypothetical protein
LCGGKSQRGSFVRPTSTTSSIHDTRTCAP